MHTLKWHVLNNNKLHETLWRVFRTGGEQLLKGGLKGTQLPQQETPIR